MGEADVPLGDQWSVDALRVLGELSVCRQTLWRWRPGTKISGILDCSFRMEAGEQVGSDESVRGQVRSEGSKLAAGCDRCRTMMNRDLVIGGWGWKNTMSFEMVLT